MKYWLKACYSRLGPNRLLLEKKNPSSRLLGGIGPRLGPALVSSKALLAVKGIKSLWNTILSITILPVFSLLLLICRA